jgi:hypothetical protein
MRRSIHLCLLLGCASGSPVESEPPGIAIQPPPELAAELVSADAPLRDGGPVGKGELPWWHALEADIYRFDGELVVLAVGDSSDHHHIAEGFMKAKVKARLAARKQAERIAFSGPMPEPELFDLFITREHRFLALYRLEVPANASLTSPAESLEAPRELSVGGMHRRGRHVFVGGRHLFLECDVEGPIANPDWGRSRASARY